jgi:hypothetical protein
LNQSPMLDPQLYSLDSSIAYLASHAVSDDAALVYAKLLKEQLDVGRHRYVAAVGFFWSWV